MLVTFKSTAYADITMFGEIAMSLLKMMGQSGQVPGAIRAKDLAAARKSLEENVAKLEPEEPERAPDPDEDAPISLSTRARPLLALLDASIESNVDVIWET
ncbi:MAG: DUF1840 domain-containing protein [Gammaproteobacteria bacterium]|nr:DUF1840 domain-containing protein [Gammaproteobacteria bacterium]